MRYPALDLLSYRRLGSAADLLPYQILAFFGEIIGMTIPGLACIALVWAAFVRPQWSERGLFSAALIVSAIFFLWSVPQFVFAHFFLRSYGSNWAMIGTVTYGPWFLFARALNRPAAAGLCALALLSCLGLPPLIGNNNLYDRLGGAGLLDVIGSALLGAAVVAVGMAVAERVGAQVFASADDAT